MGRRIRGQQSSLRGARTAPEASAAVAAEIDFDFIDIDGSHVADSIVGSFDVNSGVPVLPGTVWVAPWIIRAPLPPHDAYAIWEINPMQPAVFVMGWVNYQVDPFTATPLPRQTFTDVTHSTLQTVSLDGGAAVRMHFHDVFAECMWLP